MFDVRDVENTQEGREASSLEGVGRAHRREVGIVLCSVRAALDTGEHKGALITSVLVIFSPQHRTTVSPGGTVGACR